MTEAPSARPHVLVIAGPNGAGKSTAARSFLRSPLSLLEFVNADVIAQGLSAFNPDAAAIQAGRIMLARLKQLAEERASFAFETTLASRSFARWIQELCGTGYVFDLFFFWIPSAELAIDRVATRVQQGGHHVPPHVVRRRYSRGISNFFRIYSRLATNWRFYDNSRPESRIVAGRMSGGEVQVFDLELWDSLTTEYNDERPQEDYRRTAP